MGLEQINRIRKEKGISIDELSALSGVPKGTLSKITAGITKNPSLETVTAIAAALQCKIDAFRDDPPFPAYSPEETEVLEKFRALDPYGKRLVRIVLEEELHRTKVHRAAADERAAYQRHMGDNDETANTAPHGPETEGKG